MATISRLDYPGAIHHVYGRGNNKRDIFLDDADRAFFLGRVARLKREMEFKVYAYCLMTNHYHLLIETGPQPLATLADRLLGSYAARFNERTGGVGHVFQRPYGARLCARDSYFVRLIRYIHRNPVKAGMCSRTGDWPWSGHRQLAHGGGGLIDEELPLSFFGTPFGGARADYERFAAQDGDDCESLFEPERPRLAPSLDLIDVVEQVATDFSLRPMELLSGRMKRGLTEAKIELVRRAELQGYGQIDVARLLGCSNSALSQLRARRKAEKLIC